MGWGRVNKRRLRATERMQKSWPNPIPRARLYHQALKAEGSYGKVAKKFAVTREEVCHYVTVVKRLPADMVMAVEGEQDPHQQRRFSLRALLRIARLGNLERQRTAFRKLTRDPANASGVSRITLVPPQA